MEISGETIKNAIFEKLLEIFPNVYVYKEQITTPNFPNFFILQLTVNSDEDRKDKYFNTYLIDLRYRQTADITTELKLEQKLDDIGNDLIINFKNIMLDGRPIKIQEPNYEKDEGVLHFSFKIKIQVEKERPILTKMQNLDTNVILKGE